VTDAADGFLSRWSRRKARVRRDEADAATPASTALPADARIAPRIEPAPASPAGSGLDAGTGRAAELAPPPLPTMDDVALLTRDSDYSRFVGTAVDPGVSNAALKKLFSDPHYNVMDGLDTYIDDYGRPDPIPLSMLRRMSQSKVLGLFAADDAESAQPFADDAGDAAANATGRDAAAAATHPDAAVAGARNALPPAPLLDPTPPAGARATRPDDDADLRLQQDDAARRPGAGPGARP
jgi:hypothetical protein